MSLLTPANPDSPLMIAWRAYKETEEYANTRKWAMCERDVDGSLWAAFERGFGADRAIAQVEPPSPCGDAKALRDALRGLVDFHTKPAGLTIERIGDKDLFTQALSDIEDREKALVAAALAALQSTQAPTAAAQGQDAALARVAELEKDAARYRWLRDGELTGDYPYPVMRMGGSRVDDQTIWADELDAAIDAALAARSGT